MQIDASSVAAGTTRNDLIRAAASATRTQRTFDVQVLGKDGRAQAFSFRSIIDRVSFSAEALTSASKSAPSTTSGTEIAAPVEAPANIPIAPPGAARHLSSIDTATLLTRPGKTPAGATTLPPVVNDHDHSDDDHEKDHDLDNTFEVDDDHAGAPTPAPETMPPVIDDDDHSGHGRGHDHDHGRGRGRGRHHGTDREFRVEDDHRSGPPAGPTLPPVTGNPSLQDEIETESKADPFKTHEVLGGPVVGRTPEPEIAPEQDLPFSVVQEQMMSAFGAIDGDDSFLSALDFDGDGVIGLNDLNTLLFQQG